MNVVVDANVAIKWYLDEVHTAEAEQLVNGQFDIHAPELLLPEFGNVLWKKCRNDELDEKVAESILGSFLTRSIILHPHSTLLKAAYLGSKETGQAVYDWTYLALAISLECPLVTADRKFFIGLRKTRFKDRAVWVENIPNLL